MFENQNKWDKRFLSLCKEISTWSKDPSTKCGSVIVRPDKTIASVGFNGFPKWTSDAEELYNNREKKYERVIHAELNALLHTHEDITGYTIYATGPTCARCSAHIIQKGILDVVCDLNGWMPDRWTESISTGLEMFEEAHIEVRLVG